MKNIKKVAIVSTALLAMGVSSTYANGFGSASMSASASTDNSASMNTSASTDNSASMNTSASTDKYRAERRAERRAEMEQHKAEMKKMNDEKKEYIKTNVEKMKKNFSDFKANHKGEMKEVFSSLDKNIKTQLKESNKSFREEMKNLKEEYKKADEKSREELIKKMDETRQSHYEKMENILAGNEKALEAIKARKAVFDKNKELRKQNMQKRIEFRGKRSDEIVRYKTIFIKKLGDRIEKINNKKLERILPKIDTFIKKFEERKNLKKESQDKIISELTALKEIIQEKLENSQAEQADIDVEATLN